MATDAVCSKLLLSK